MAFIVALVVGAGVAALAMWMRSKGIASKWYEWVIGIIGLAFLLFAIQNFFGSGAEGESDVAGKYILIVGLPSLVLVAISGVLVWRRNQVTA